MFDHNTFLNRNADEDAISAARQRAAFSNGANAPRAKPSDANTNTDLAWQRTIVDQIDLSIEASQRIETALGDFQRPVFAVDTSPLEAFEALQPALDEARTRMNREAFIVLAMMGVPPAKARAMANAMTGGAPGELKAVDTNGDQDAMSALELSLNISRGSAKVNPDQVSVTSRTVDINFQAIENRFSNVSGASDVSISEFRAHIELIRVEIAQTFQKDPLILDLDGNGIDITSLQDGKIFDIDGDGTLEQTAWIQGADALLALDRNNNGKIDDGRELFGDQNGAKDGFAELSKYDDNLDGVIDKMDGVFSSLVLLRADGSQQSLVEGGIKSISLSLITPLDERLIGGNLVAGSQFEREDGTTGQVGEIFFDVQA